MNLNFFKETKILDGGMGQELLARGLISKGTLWSASALIEEKFHKLLIDVHVSFINAGADVICTNTFSARMVRMIENKVAERFNYVNEKACELAIKAKELSKKNILVAGALPSQRDSYVEDIRTSKEIENDFSLNSYFGFTDGSIVLSFILRISLSDISNSILDRKSYIFLTLNIPIFISDKSLT